MTKIETYSLSVEEIIKKNHCSINNFFDITSYFLERTDNLNQKYNSHIWWNKQVIKQYIQNSYENFCASYNKKNKLPLAGVPIAIKDNIITKDIPTTCGSKILANFISFYDATVITKLKQAGAIIFGKTNCDEFAMGSSNENSAFGAVLNPWDIARVPGGSSGGSAVAVATDMVPVALGSDTGGSIRQPASFCGVVGFKPSYGRVSRYGLVAYASSLDQIGSFSRSVLDSALILDIISGYDPKDSTTLPMESTHAYDTLKCIKKGQLPLKDYKIAYIKELLDDGVDPQIQEHIKQSIEDFRILGAQVHPIKFSMIHYSIATYYIIATAEASANLARFDGIRYGYRALENSNTELSLSELYFTTRSNGFGKEVKRRIMLGTFVLSSGYYDAYYNKANKVRYLIKQELNKIFKDYDFLICPTSPILPFKLGEKIENPLSMYLSDICTLFVNLAGLPAISLPCGYSQEGLPIGLQIIGGYLQDEKVLLGAYCYERFKYEQINRHPAV